MDKDSQPPSDPALASVSGYVPVESAPQDKLLNVMCDSPATLPVVACSALLAAKYRRRDELLRSVWSIMREISDHDDEAKMSDEDLAVWGEVTAHSAIQSRLDAALKITAVASREAARRPNDPDQRPGRQPKV